MWEDRKPNCDSCRKRFKGFGKEPDCRNCVPSLLPENENLYEIFSIVRTQCISTQIGKHTQIDLNIGILKDIFDMYDVENTDRPYLISRLKKLFSIVMNKRCNDYLKEINKKAEQDRLKTMQVGHKQKHR